MQLEILETTLEIIIILESTTILEIIQNAGNYAECWALDLECSYIRVESHLLDRMTSM